MDTFKSNLETVDYDIETVYDKLSNPECFGRIAQSPIVPDDMKQRLKDVEFTADSIAFKADPVGRVCLQITERTRPCRIVMQPQGFPMPFSAVINLEKQDEQHTQLQVEFNIELNFMLRTMASKPLTDGVQKFGQMLSMLPYDKL